MSRKIKASALAVMVFVVTCVTGAANASHTCSGTVQIVGDYYVEYRDQGGIWIYQEFNNVAGLQRGGVSMAGSIDPCPYHPTPGVPGPDKLIF